MQDTFARATIGYLVYSPNPNPYSNPNHSPNLNPKSNSNPNNPNLTKLSPQRELGGGAGLGFVYKILLSFESVFCYHL